MATLMNIIRKHLEDKTMSKLYTEEQVRKAWNTAYVDALALDNEDYKPTFYDDFIASLTPIQLPTMHKEEIKMIIKHYHNSLFYLELTEIELENITKMIYKEIFGGQDNE